MSFCFLYNVVSENHSVQNSPRGGRGVYCQLKVYLVNIPTVRKLCLNIGFLAGCFGFNGPLRQYFSLYRAVSQREGERRERIDESKKSPNHPHLHLLQVQQALSLL